jgi:hypothetical protein
MKLKVLKIANFLHFQGRNSLNSIQTGGNINLVFTYTGYRDEIYTVVSRHKDFMHVLHKYAILFVLWVTFFPFLKF